MKVKIRYISVLCILLLLLISTSIDIGNVKGEINKENNKPNNITSSHVLYEGIYMDSAQDYFTPTDNIEASFLVSNELSIESFEYVQIGFSNVDINIDPNNNSRILIDLVPFENQEEYFMEIQLQLENNKQTLARLFLINTPIGSFISPCSIDDARERCFMYAIDHEMMTYDQYIDICAELSKECLIADADDFRGIGNDGLLMISDQELLSTLSNEANGIISGKITWMDDWNDEYNLIFAQVKIFYDGPYGEELLATVKTNENGEFYAAIPANDNIIVRIYAGNEKSMVKKPVFLEPYYIEYDNISVTVGNVTRIDADPIGMLNNNGQAFQIAQASIVGVKYAEQMTNNSVSAITVLYPSNVDTCCFNSVNNTMYINQLPWDNYRDWDLILHEYGHHVQSILGIIVSPIVDEHHTHDDAAYLQRSVEKGSRLAWGESWNNIFAIMAQYEYEDYFPNVVGAADNTVFGVDLENECVKLGESCEESVMAVLWDLYDADADDVDNDGISLDHDGFWDLTAVPGTIRFSQVANRFYEQYPNDLDKFASILSKYHIAPFEISRAYGYTMTLPMRITFSKGGSTSYPNNRYDIVFFNAEKQEIMRIEDIESNSDEYTQTYSMSSVEWNQLLTSAGNTCTQSRTIYISVAGYRDEELIDDTDITYFTSGPYYSEFFEVNLSVSHDYSVCRSIDADDHAMYCSRCNAMQPGSTDGHVWTPLDDNWAECTECGYSKRLGGLGPFIPVIRPGAIEPEEDEIETE